MGGVKKSAAMSSWSFGAAAIIMFTTAACVNQTAVYQPPGAPLQDVSPPPPHFVEAPPSQCVPYARARSGIEIMGDAGAWWALAGEEGYPRTSRPEPGAVMVLQVGADGARGHVAYVDEVISSREIIVDHANWHGRGEVAVDVPVIDVSPNNDWSEVHVLWLDSGEMGAKTYAVEGFVLPLGHSGV